MTKANILKLGQGRKGMRGRVIAVGVAKNDVPSTDPQFDLELERRLLEIGFVEGAQVEVLHEGFIGRDPIAVRVDSMRVALRRREAEAILVQVDPATDVSGAGRQ